MLKTRWSVISIIVFFIFSLTGAVMAGNFPATDKMAGMKGGTDVPFVVQYDAQSHRYTIRIPVSGDQPGGVDKMEVFVYIRGLWNEADGWYQFRDLKTEVLKRDKREMTVAFTMPSDMRGAKFYRIRLAGSNGQSALWIIQGDTFARLNTDHEIAYEWWVDTDGRAAALPKSAPLWNDHD